MDSISPPPIRLLVLVSAGAILKKFPVASHANLLVLSPQPPWSTRCRPRWAPVRWTTLGRHPYFSPVPRKPLPFLVTARTRPSSRPPLQSSPRPSPRSPLQGCPITLPVSPSAPPHWLEGGVCPKVLFLARKADQLTYNTIPSVHV